MGVGGSGAERRADHWGDGVGGVGGTVVEPVYDDMTGAIRYVSTPRGTPDPVKSNPIAAAPFYLPVYPVGSSVPATFTLNCLDVPVENCPDHGAAVAGAAQAIIPSVYGGGTRSRRPAGRGAPAGRRRPITSTSPRTAASAVDAPAGRIGEKRPAGT